jgi:subtilisin family serine protease
MRPLAAALPLLLLLTVRPAPALARRPAPSRRLRAPLRRTAARPRAPAPLPAAAARSPPLTARPPAAPQVAAAQTSRKSDPGPAGRSPSPAPSPSPTPAPSPSPAPSASAYISSNGPPSFARPGGAGGAADAPTKVMIGYSSEAAAIAAPAVPGLLRRPGSPLATLALNGTETLAAALARARALPGALVVEPDYKLYATATPNDPRYSSLWGMAKIQAPAAWDLSTGGRTYAGAKVCVIDTGIDYAHPDLAANIVGQGYSPITGGNAFDDNSHGTHCAGTIAGVGNNGVGVAGVAWAAQVIGCKFLDASGSGSTSDAIRCVDYCIAQGAKVLSNSWGGGGDSALLRDAIQRAAAAGALFVVAAGNEANNNDVSPSYPASNTQANILAVASTTSADGMSSFSNYGATSVDVGAPGSDIWSTVPGNGYASYSGTSMATPHVAGLAALMISACAVSNGGTCNLNAATDIKRMIMLSVDPIPALAGKCVTGGRINALKALQLAVGGAALPPASPPLVALPPPPPPSPTLPPVLAATALPLAGTLPYVSPAFLDISAGTTAAIDPRLVAGCPSPFSSRLADTTGSYRKAAFKLTNVPSTAGLTVGNCGAAWDSMIAVLSCAPDLSACACYANDDGCGVVGGPDRVASVPSAAGKDLYVLVTAYSSATASGQFKLNIVNQFPPPPPPLAASPPPPPAVASPSPVAPAPSPAPVTSFPSTPITIATYPYTSPTNLNIGTGTTTAAWPAAPFAACPPDFRARLNGVGFRKVAFKLALPAAATTLSVDTCTKINRATPTWDSMLAVLRCDAAMNCDCFANDDACGVASRVASLARSAARPDVYAVVNAYVASTTAGAYRLAVRA